ncbi:HD domain-containing protein [Clostridium beijerinckii]|uniref:HD domain-containing protein n=1 Tax=Clostridium beijerinckii TaxID=1520 RepID=UPI0022264FC4|nr:HD domain-containing protein [Clostridium beijerinckii]UYZ36771.1 HD domain-containing protein [Clostridium beijerinckii]
MENNKIQENKEKFLTLLNGVQRIGIDKLIDWLGNRTDFFEAPASTMFHGNYEGALCEHSINVYELFNEKNKRYDLGLSEDSVKIMGLLHDICKVNFYKLSSRNKKIDGQWRAIPWYDVEDEFPVGHGEKSVIILMSYIGLTNEEKMAIRWHMGGYEPESNYRTLSAAWDKYKSGCCLHTADLEASNLLEIKIDYENPNKQIKMDLSR